MEAVGVYGASPLATYCKFNSEAKRISISSLCLSSYRTSNSTSSNSCSKKLNLESCQTSPQLFCYSQSRLSHRTKTRIFLPHLVASLEEVERTYIMVKPDGVHRGLVGEIISRFEKKGFKLTGLKLFQCPNELAEEHYKDLKSKSFFPKLMGNIVHGSDSPENGEREIALWFKEGEICDWTPALAPWLME